MTRMARWIGSLGLVSAIAVGGAGCSSGSGGSAPPSACNASTSADSGHTWTELYRDYFGPTGGASCAGSSGQCHGAPGDPGVVPSGFVCGSTQESCFDGIVARGSIVPMGGSSAPTTTRLYAALRKAAPASGGSMPRSPSCVAFTSDDLARINAWISSGASND